MSEPPVGPRLVYLVKRLEMAERRRLTEALRPLGVALHQYTVLSILEHRAGLSSAQLARRHFVSPQAMHQLTAAMERDGLIERRPAEGNRRTLEASLTDRGAEVLRSCHAAADAVESRMLGALGEGGTAAFRRSVLDCLAALEGPSADTATDAGP